MTDRTHADVLHRFIETHVICAGKHGSKPGYTDAHEALGALLADLAAATERADGAEEEINKLLADLTRYEAQLVAAREALTARRPLLDEEWAAMMAEHDVVAEARKLSKSAGAINTLHDLDRALAKYDAAIEAAHSARAALAASGTPPVEGGMS